MSPISPPHCTAEGEGLRGGHAGVACEFSVSIYNDKNQLVNPTNVNIKLHFEEIKKTAELFCWTATSQAISYTRCRRWKTSISQRAESVYKIEYTNYR